MLQICRKGIEETTNQDFSLHVLSCRGVFVAHLLICSAFLCFPSAFVLSMISLIPARSLFFPQLSAFVVRMNARIFSVINDASSARIAVCRCSCALRSKLISDISPTSAVSDAPSSCPFIRGLKPDGPAQKAKQETEAQKPKPKQQALTETCHDALAS